MTIAIYILDGGHWDGQYAFAPWESDNQHTFTVYVPDNSRIIEGNTVLITPTGNRLSASTVVVYGRLGIEGFRNDIPHQLSAWHR